MRFDVSPQYPRNSRQLLIVVVLSCCLAAHSVHWHMPDMHHASVAAATTTQCEVCGTVPPPVTVPGSAGTTTPALPVTTTPAPPFAPSRYMVTTTNLPSDPYHIYGPEDVSTTWPMKSKTGVIAVATAGAVAVGGLIAGIVAITQIEPSSTTPGRLLAATTTDAISPFSLEGTAPGTSTVSHAAYATPLPTIAPTRTLDQKATSHRRVAKGSSGIQAKYDSAQIAHMARVNENGVTTILVAGCIVFAVILLVVGFATYFPGSYTRRTRTLYLQAENGDEPQDGDQSVSALSCDDDLE